MAWIGKEPTREEILKSLGMTEAEFTAMQAKAAKTDSLESQVANQNTEMTTIKASLAALEGRVAAPVNNNGGGDGNNNNNTPNLRDWNEDADGAFNDRVKPIVGLTLQVQAELVFTRVFKRMRQQNKIYELLEVDAEKLVKAQPLNVQINESVVENCFKVAYANNADQIQKDNANKEGKFFMESGSNQGNGIPNDNSNAVKLTPAEERAATSLGVTPEKYLEMKKGMTFVA